MKLFYKKGKSSIVIMVVLAMLLQIVGPVVGDYVYALGEEEGFKAVTSIVGDVATVEWEYEFTPNGELKHNIPVDFILTKDEEIFGELESEEGVIGEYRISKDGEMNVTIDENIEEIVRNLVGVGEPEVEETVPLIPLVPAEHVEPEISDDIGDSDDNITDGIDDEDNLNQIPEEGTGEETNTETEINEEEEIEDDSARIINNLLGLFSKNVVYADGTDEEVESYIFSGSFQVEGVSLKSMIRPLNVGLSGESFEMNVNTNVITKITAKKGNQELKDISEYRPVMGEKIDLYFEFTLPEKHNYGKDSTLIYPLPNPLKPASGSGLLAKDGEEYAEYKIEGGNVVITFNEKIRFYVPEGSEGLLTTGEFRIEAEYSAHEGNTDLEHGLKLPGSDDITLTFKPKGGKVIEEKEVTADNSNKNSQYVEWTVNVNTEMENLDPGKEFKDTLTGNHLYDKSSFTIKQYEVDALGNSGAETSVTLTPQFASDNKSFTLNLTGKYAYEIKYKTIPGDTEEQSQTLSNKAEFGGVPKTKDTTITYGSPLDKEVSNSGETANWKITVNKNRRTIANGTTITDTWGTNAEKHELVGTVPTAFTVSGIDSSKYTITSDTGQGFILTLTEAVTEEFTIEYSTNPKDLVTGNISLKNSVVRSDRPTDPKSATAVYNQNVLNKSNSGPNYQNKTVDWTIVLNSAGYTMPIGTVITDEFVNKNLKIVDGTFKVNGVVINDSSSDYTLVHSDGDVDEDKKGGFILTTKKEITGPITITYTTGYDVKSVTNLETYKNTVGIKWDWNSKDYSVSGIDSTVTINDQQKAKGYKTGSYNYEKKEFKWEVGINYNFDTIKNAVFTDTLPATQKVDKGNIKVYELDLSSGGDGTQGAEVTNYDIATSADNILRIEFEETIEKPYRIIYKSKDKDDYYAPNASNHTVKNEAKLEGGDYTATWAKTVTVEHSNKLITKNHNTSKYSGSAKLGWEMKLNWSQSKLADVVITDEIGLDTDGNPNQKIYEDSFKIYEMNFSGEISNPSKGTEHKPGEGLYDVKFSPDGSSFEIKFNNTIDKAYTVEYESYFLGASGSELKNTVKLSYTTSTSDKSNDEHQFLNSNFTFSGSATNKKGLLEITKVDKDNSDIKLSGAEFELWSAKTGGFLIERVSTDTDGVYKFKTKVGQTRYYLIETRAPEGYSREASEYNERQEVNINADVTPITVENKKIHQSVKLTKVDKDDETIKLSGAKFKLYNVDNTEVTQDAAGESLGELVTDENGELVVNNLPEGNYYFKEAVAPENYIKLDAKIEFIIIKDQIKTVEVKVKNTRGMGKITITKVDAEDNNIKLEGAEFKLTDIDGNEYQVTKNADKTLTFDNLEYGTYTLVETKAPEGYTLVSKSKEIILDGERNHIDLPVSIENTKKIDIIGTKEWIGGPTAKPTIWFELYRNIINTDPLPVEGAEIKKLEDRTTEAKWDDLDKVDENGNEYIYSIKEVNEAVEDFEPTNYKKAENGLKVTNYYVSPTDGSAKAVKKWVDGPINKPTIWFKLYRHIEGGEKEEVPSYEAPIKELISGITEVVWTELTKTDNNGKEYIFSVKEVDKNGNHFEPTNYEKIEDGLTVTNTYLIPKIEVKGTKEWIGGSSNRPTIELQLYRDGMKLGEPVELKDGETKYTWTDLDETDINGKEYKYTIDEVNVPRNYGKSISDDGLTVINRYYPPYYPPTGGGGGQPPRPTDPKPPVVPPTDPTKPVDPVKPTDPEEPVEIQEVPKEPNDPTIKEETPKDTPKEGEIEVPEGSTPKVNNPPANGTVTIDPNGKWTYTPNPGFVGKDSFTIIITHPDGTEEEIFVEIDVDEPPLGNIEAGGSTPEEPVKTLPKTGSIGRLGFYISGLLFIILGIFIVRRKTE